MHRVRRIQPGRDAQARLGALALDPQLVLGRDQQRVIAAEARDRLAERVAAAAQVLEQLVVAELQLGAGAQRRRRVAEHLDEVEQQLDDEPVRQAQRRIEFELGERHAPARERVLGAFSRVRYRVLAGFLQQANERRERGQRDAWPC